jgi:hypothetical protein
MARIGTAFRAFFGSLFNAETAERVGKALDAQAALPGPPQEPPKAAPRPPEPKKPEKPRPPARSDAVTLLATLQREARLIDFVQEPLDGLSDQQIGAAVRDIHRNLAAALNRMFSIGPVLSEAEGARVEVPKGFDAGQYRLVGNVAGEPPFHGTLAHHGWQCQSVQLPEWSGGESSATVLAPAEVELK